VALTSGDGPEISWFAPLVAGQSERGRNTLAWAAQDGRGGADSRRSALRAPSEIGPKWKQDTTRFEMISSLNSKRIKVGNDSVVPFPEKIREFSSKVEFSKTLSIFESSRSISTLDDIENRSLTNCEP
jgi:hypothetical protein